jgi:hypothetical protein
MGEWQTIKDKSGKEIGRAKIDVEHADGDKCPRCWHYHTVQGNPQGLCDRCVSAILEGLDDFVREGRVTQADADEFRAEVKAMVNRWKAKT